MAFNGSGVYSLAAGNPVVTGTVISSTWANNTLNDIATGLTTALCKDGQSTPTANIKMGGFKFTGLGAGTLNGDSIRFEQLPSATNLLPVASGGTGSGTAAGARTNLGAMGGGDIQVQTSNAATTTGTPPAYVAAFSPVIASLVANKTRVNVTFAAGNGGSVPTTLDIGTGPIGLKVYAADGSKIDPTITAGMMGDVQYDGTNHVILNSLATGNTQLQPFPTPTTSAGSCTIPAQQYTLDFRNSTISFGGKTTITGTPAALTIPAGATLGGSSGVPISVNVLVMNVGGVLEYAVVNVAGGILIDEEGIISTTAIGSTSNSGSSIYSTTARSSIAYRKVGRADFNLATAGQWTSAATVVPAGGYALLGSIGGYINDVTASRALGVSYVGTLGKTRVVTASISTLGTAAFANYTATVTRPGVAGVVTAYLSIPASSIGNCCFEVPPGCSYQFNLISGTAAAVQYWSEYDRS